MPTDPPARRGSGRPRAVPKTASSETAFDDILSVLGEQLGVAAQTTQDPKGLRRLKGMHLEFENEARDVHDMAGGAGYSLASNWFTQLLGQLAVANSITKSQLCVFLFVAGGQAPGTGIAQYTQQEITDGLNKLAANKPNAKKITRSTVNRAIKALCAYKWVEQVGNGKIRMNVRLWFQGNSSAQHEVLAELRVLHDHEKNPTAFPYDIGPEEARQGELDLDFGKDSYGRGERAG